MNFINILLWHYGASPCDQWDVKHLKTLTKKKLDGRGQHVEPVSALTIVKMVSIRWQLIVYLAFFVKVGHSDLVLWVITWSGRVHALMKFQRSGPSGQQDMELTRKTDYVVHFCEK